MHFNQQITDLIFILKSFGIKHAILCPGSRNAPLIQGFHRDPQFVCHSIVDERSAGYVALGMARELGEPVIVVTTSGTAALNLAPAVAEAYYQDIPLVFLTADRPAAWPPQVNNQIIDQQEIFIKNSRAFYNIPFEIPDRKALLKINNEIYQIISDAMKDSPGPVHLNVQLTEPLYQPLPVEFSGALTSASDNQSATWLSNDVSPEHENMIPAYIAGGKKVLVLAGMGKYSQEEENLLVSLSELFQVVVVAENISNLSADLFIKCPEIVLGSQDADGWKALSPEMIIAVGKQIVSKRISFFLKELDKIPVIIPDAFPSEIFSTIVNNDLAFPANSYLELWKSVEAVSRNKAKMFLRGAPYSNLTAVGQILSELPDGSQIHLGNSGAIRYSQLLPANSGLQFYANRGTSGIDGSLSTAVGAAMVSDKLHIAILGDLSFLYDSNGLWNRDFPTNLRIIVLNDRGGGIFRIIQGPEKMPFFEDFSLAHHPVSLKLLTEAYGLKYCLARNFDELKHQTAVILQEDAGPLVLEVDTGLSENSSIFKQFYYSLKN